MKCITCKYLSLSSDDDGIAIPFCNALDRPIHPGFVNRTRVRGESGMCKKSFLEVSENDASRRGEQTGVSP
jgi:hypothetical protein